MALSAIRLEQLAINAVDRTAVPTALKTLRDEATTDAATAQPGAPMQNRVRLLGAPGAIVAGDTVTIGADTYEFNAATPPAAGTAAMIWVYQGATSAESRANLIKAINGTVDAALVTRTAATNTELVVASAGVTLGDVLIQSADAIGGTVIPSTDDIATTSSLSTGTDIWDAANMYGGRAQALRAVATKRITVTAAQIAKGDLQFTFDFTPTNFILDNHMRQQSEAAVISGNSVSLTLSGGASPNVQANDVIDCTAFGA